MMAARVAPAQSQKIDFLTDRVTLLRRRADSFEELGTVWARVRTSYAKRGNSHSLVIRFRTDLKGGDFVRVTGGAEVEILSTGDLNGRRLFLAIVADAARASSTRRAISRSASEGE